MCFRGFKISPFIISVVALIAITAAVCIGAASCNRGKLVFKCNFYFVCYSIEDNTISAGSISSAVSNYGGAGYVLEYNGAYYVTVSCYYSENDAKSVCLSLQGRNLNCSVLSVETDNYVLTTSSSKKNENLYKGNLNTLSSVSRLAYDCANALDTGEYGQIKAKNVISNIKKTLEGLADANSQNCFSSELRRLISVCEECSAGYTYSKDLRKLQIAIADTIINIKLF